MPLARDTLVSLGNNNNSDTLTFNHTVESGSNKIIVMVSWEDLSTTAAPSVSSITFNSDPLTYSGVRARLNWGGDNYIVHELWYRDNPDTGSSYQVAITLSEAASRLVATATSYSDAEAGVFNGAAQTGSGSQESVDIANTETTSFVVGGICRDTTAKVWTETTEEEYWEYNAANLSAWFGQDDGNGGTVTLDPTVDSTAGRWAISAVEIREAAAAVSPPPRLRPLRQWRGVR